MKINEMLKLECILPDLAARNKPAVLKEFCNYLKDQNILTKTEDLYDALIERENLGSTGIGENVAIPHAKSEQIDHLLCVFGRSVKGIDFDSLDEKNVHFIFLLIAPANSTGQHLKALARISRLLKSNQLRENILNAQTAEEIYSVFLEEDSKFI